MAALYRKPDGMLMSEISRFLMVSNGNVTGIVDRLVSDGLVARAQRNGDRRTSFISLTRKGRALFADMAAAHESWVDELARRRLGARRRAAVGQAEIVPQRLGGRSMSRKMAALKPAHFLWRMDGAVAVIQLNRPERKNPLTFESYAELRDTFRDLALCRRRPRRGVPAQRRQFLLRRRRARDHRPAGRHGRMKELLAFTRMTGDLVKAMLHCGKPIIAAVDGVAPAPARSSRWPSDLRLATPAAQTAFLFNRVGLAGCDMGACAILPRIIGQGRAAELLYTGRAMTAQEGERWGFFNRLVAADALEQEALALARRIAAGPTFANGITKTQLDAGMVDEPRSGHRGRGAGAGDLHADQGFRARLSGVRRQAETGVRGRLVADKTFLTWPFFTDRHRALAAASSDWARRTCRSDHGDVDAACRELVQKLGRDGWLAHTAPDPDAPAALDVRTLCLIRETLARHDGLADFAFAMQGLGAGPISLFGNAEQRDWLKRTRSGEAIAAFALTEQKSGSDVANIAMTARARRRRLRARRREDLDLQRRHRRPLRRVRAHRRRPRRQGPLGFSACPRNCRAFPSPSAST